MNTTPISRPAAVAPLVVALAAFFSVGCADRSWQTAYRLERAAALAVASAETTFLDFGTEQARASLIDGWSFNETNDAGVSFVWSHGPTSSFGVYAFPEPDPAEPTATLHFRALVFEAPDAPEQSLHIALNGREIGEVVLPAGIADSNLQFPADVLRTGWNIFDIRYAWTRSELASQAERRWRRVDRDLAVAWIEARVEHPSVESAPAAAPDIGIDLRGERLLLPPNSLLEYEFEIGPGFRIAVGDASCPGCVDNWRIEIYAGELNEPSLRLAGALTDTTNTTSLGPQAFDTRRLLLRNRSTGTVSLERPKIERPVVPLSP